MPYATSYDQRTSETAVNPQPYVLDLKKKKESVPEEPDSERDSSIYKPDADDSMGFGYTEAQSGP